MTHRQHILVLVVTISLVCIIGDLAAQDTSLNQPQPVPEDPFQPGGPYAREMERRRQAARLSAAQTKPAFPNAVPRFNPSEYDLLDLIHRLARDGADVRLIVDPPPRSEWHLELLTQNDTKLRLPVHPDTPLAWTENLLFRADVDPRRRGYSVAAFDLKTGTKRWERQIVGLGAKDEEVLKNCAYLEVRDEQLWVIGKEPNGRFAEVFNLRSGEPLDERVDRRPITLEELKEPNEPGVIIGDSSKREKRMAFDEQNGIVFYKAEATLLHSLQMHNGDCVLRLTPDTGRTDVVMTIDFRYDESIAYTISARPHCVFRTVRDRLFAALYAPWSCSCAVCAVDLKSGAEIWRTRLKGVGIVVHSAYFNDVNMDLTLNGLEVIGHEAYGDYWERLNPQTGQTIAHRVFRLGWQ